MTQKSYLSVSSFFFFLVALLHLARLIRGWEAAIGGVAIPVWVSGVALVVSLFLAVQGYRLSRE